MGIALLLTLLVYFFCFILDVITLFILGPFKELTVFLLTFGQAKLELQLQCYGLKAPNLS
jgi:hypothetical protein